MLDTMFHLFLESEIILLRTNEKIVPVGRKLIDI